MMRKAYFTVIKCLLLSVLVTPVVADTQPVTIELNKFSEVVHSEVLLGDVISFMEVDNRYSDAIRAIPILTVDRVNQYRSIKKDKIRYLIEKKLAVTVSLKGPEVVAVKLLSQPYDMTNAVDAVTRKLQHNLELLSKKSTVKAKASKKEIYLPFGNVSYDFLIDEGVLSKRVCVWVRFNVNGKHYQSVPLWFEQEVLNNVLISNKNINAGEIVNPSDFSEVEIDITMHKDVVGPNQGFSGTRTTKRLLKGNILLKKHLEALPDVYKGQYIELVSKSGAVTINAVGVAEMDGSIGSTIIISRENSLEKFEGVVLSPGKVKVEGS